MIKAVNDFDMVISLPNHLTGFVSCERVSSSMVARLAAVTSGDMAAVAEIPSLEKLYTAGELVTAVISGLVSPTGGKRRIELSLLPSKVNKDIKPEELASGTIVAGEIKSREDRGYTVDLGLCTEGEMVGFLPDSEAPAGLVEGKTVALMVAASFKERASRVITLTMNTRSIVQTRLPREASVEALRCGSLVSAQITAVAKLHIEVSFAGYSGRIDVLNLPDNVMLKRHKDLELSEHFSIGKKLDARLIHIDYEEKHFMLSAKLGILQWKVSLETERIGARIEESRVMRIDPKMGVLISIKEDAFAYVHISRLSEEHVEQIDGPFKVGTKHVARLIDYDAFSGLYLASFKSLDLSAPILRIQDLHPGQTVRGEAIRIEKYGVLISLSERIRAICPLAQLSEVPSDMAIKAYTLGQKYKFRVLDCDPKTRRITLTRKRGLLESTLPILSSYEAAQPENFYTGYIAAIREFGIIVRFYGEVKGIVTVNEMSEEYQDIPQESFFIGQVVKCRVVSCDPAAKALKVSFRKQSGPKLIPGEKRKSKEVKVGPEQQKKTKIDKDTVDR